MNFMNLLQTFLIDSFNFLANHIFFNVPARNVDVREVKILVCLVLWYNFLCNNIFEHTGYVILKVSIKMFAASRRDFDGLCGQYVSQEKGEV